MHTQRCAFCADAALGHADLFGVGELSGQVRRRRVSRHRLGCKAAQNHFLQPRRQVWPMSAWRRWLHPQTLAQPTVGLRLAERQLASRELVEHHAYRKNIATRIAPHADYLLRCHPRWRANRLAQFLRKQVGIVTVVAQSEIEQYCRSVIPDQHIGGLQIMMHHVLLMQTMYAAGNRSAEMGNCRGIECLPGFPPLIKPMLQRPGLHVFHYQIGNARDIPRRHKARHVCALQRTQNLLLHLKSDNVFRAITVGHARHFHRHRKARIALSTGRACCVMNAIDVRHAARVNAGVDHEPVQRCARFQQLHSPRASRSAKKPGSPAARIAVAARL